MFIIVMEKCQPLPPKIKSYVNVHAKDINYFFKTQDTGYLIPFEKDYKLLYLKYDLGMQFLGIMEEIRENFGENIFERKQLDIHGENFMMKGNNLCFIDIFTPEYKSKIKSKKN